MLSYRYDIDGLRAIAVLAVLGFHIIPWKIPGGFIGVDVFFVISGFLITRILWRDLGQYTFSLQDFYARRIKRLFPALFSVLLASAGIQFFFGLPDEINNFGRSAISAAFYFSNHFFLNQNDYFSESLEYDPLLHTWSLSVEEQFYIVFPLLLAFLYRNHRALALPILWVLAASSFAFSEVLLIENQSASFFVAPSRFWQFLAGSLLALSPLNRKMPRGVMEIVCLMGLGMITASVFLYSGKSIFPGVGALLPTLGTVLVLFAGQQHNQLSHHLLSNNIASFFSKISYSLYLWHWPLIVFFKIHVMPDPDAANRLLLIAGSILLGYLGWRYIETPIRHMNLRKQPGLVIGAGVAASVGISLIGLTFVLTDGGKDRFSEAQLSYIDYLTYDASPYYRTDTCFLTSNSNDISDFQKDICVSYHFSKPNVLLIGDSHGAQYFHALKESLPSVEFSQVNASGCRPLVNYQGEERCTVLMRLAFEQYAREYKFDAIILAGRWETEDMDALSATVDQLAKITKKVIVLGPIIEYKQALPRLLARYEAEEPALSEARLFEQVQKIDTRMQSILALSDTEYYSILNTICPHKGCKVFTQDGMPIQFDASHLTHKGALEIITLLVKQGMLKGLTKSPDNNS